MSERRRSPAAIVDLKMEGTQQASWALGQPAALVLLLVGGGRRRRRQRAGDILGSSRRGSEALERAAEWRRCGSRALVGVDRRPHTRNGAGTRSPRAPKIVGRIGVPVQPSIVAYRQRSRARDSSSRNSPRACQQGKLRRLAPVRFTFTVPPGSRRD